MSIVKKFNPDTDIVTTISTVEEAIHFRSIFFNINRQFQNSFISSGTVSGSYFVSLYDNAYSTGVTEFGGDASANKILTIGYGIISGAIPFSTSFNANERSKFYRLYSKKLLGNEENIFSFNNRQERELIFVSLARNQIKDGIKPNSLVIDILQPLQQQPISSPAMFARLVDIPTQGQFAGGRVGTLFSASAVFEENNKILDQKQYGYVFYDTGDIVLSPIAFPTGTSVNNQWSGTLAGFYHSLVSGNSGSVTGVHLQNDLLNGIANKFVNISFTNQSKVYTTFYNCVAEKEEFNYSSNPSFLNEQGIIITNSGTLKNIVPTTFITTIALVNENNEVMAVAKVSEARKKDYRSGIRFIPRLNY